MIDNNQQLKPYRARVGYPLASDQFNDIFDSAIYDLIVLLTQDIATVPDIFKNSCENLATIEALALREFNKDIDFVKQDHTENWRTI